jgi:hypothetical protein
LGSADGVAYKDPDGYAADGGVSAATRIGTVGPFVDADIHWATNQNSYVLVP